MTTKPKLRVGSHLLPGLAAVALFVVIAVAVLRASFGDPQGFPSDGSITASIGYAMFNLDMGAVPGEGFLVSLIVIAVALDAALDGSLLLAKREQDGSAVALLADGGRRVRDRLTDGDGADVADADDDVEGGDR
ncbi:proton-conducting membrane transporter [Haloplanus rallus]|uniref:Proton-conducting membrane transporter n=1 Tax=Haloplanus rallus TaxID=1816183 RepID=A0A6B9FCW6_9EURY|nr:MULTISPECIES: proton-conducting membrane transporter [Haloplanus]QGX94100.1 proton-conducting membrane transporter [Haloplanus rallus]